MISIYTLIFIQRFILLNLFYLFLKKSFNFKNRLNILNIACRRVTQFKLDIFNLVVFNGKNIKEFQDFLID